MHLGAAGCIGEPRPIGAAPVEPQPGRVDQIDALAQGTAQMPVGLADHPRKQFGEHRRRAARIGIGQGRALRWARPQMVQPGPMAAQAGDDLAQARGSRQLAIQQGDQLAFGGQAPHPGIGPVLLDQPIEDGPREMLQKRVKNGILVQHGIDLLLCPDRRRNVPNPVESMSCPQSSKNEPDSRGFMPGIHVFSLRDRSRRGWPGQARPRGLTVDPVGWKSAGHSTVVRCRAWRNALCFSALREVDESQTSVINFFFWRRNCSPSFSSCSRSNSLPAQVKPVPSSSLTW